MGTLGFSEIEQLRQFLVNRGFSFAHDIRPTYSAPKEYAVLVSADKVRNFTRLGQNTSFRQMKMIQAAAFKMTGLKIDWVVTESEVVVEIEMALLGALHARFPGTIKAVQISALNRSPIWVWLDPESQTVSRPPLDTIQEVVGDIFKAYGYSPPSGHRPPLVAFLDGPELPSDIVLLRYLKTLAPATKEQFSEYLHSVGAVHPSLDWLQKHLDKLRKLGKITRASSGTYALTDAGLQIVPHGRTRKSSDIQRALALGRKKW